MVSSGTEERVEWPTRHSQGRQQRTSRGKAGNQTAFQMRSERGLHVGHVGHSERRNQHAQMHVPCNHNTWETEVGDQRFEVSLEYQQDSVLKM